MKPLLYHSNYFEIESTTPYRSNGHSDAERGRTRPARSTQARTRSRLATQKRNHGSHAQNAPRLDNPRTSSRSAQARARSSGKQPGSPTDPLPLPGQTSDYTEHQKIQLRVTIKNYAPLCWLCATTLAPVTAQPSSHPPVQKRGAKATPLRPLRPCDARSRGSEVQTARDKWCRLLL